MKVNRIILLILAIIAGGCGSALTLKAGVGVGAWDALAKTTSELSGIAIGTCGIVFNCLCIVVQVVILRKKFKKSNLLQIPLSLLLGVVINFVLYDLLGSVTIDAYWINMILFLFGTIFCAFCVAIVMVLDIVTYALEGACMAVVEVTGKKFHVIRQSVDVIAVIVCLLLSFSLGLPVAVREGTVIGMLVFGPLLGIFMKILKPIFKKYRLVEYH